MAERQLRIGVDGRELVGRATGVGRYIGEVLRAWATEPTWPHTLIVFTPVEPPAALTASLGPRITWQVVPSDNTGTWWEQWHLPRAVRRAGIDAFFAGAYTAPLLLTCPSVLVIHDVSYFAHPEWFSHREGLRRRWLTRESAKRAHEVLTVSEFSASEIARWVGISRDRIVLAQQGAPPRQPARESKADPTVLYVGSLFTRRLIAELITGFAEVARSIPDARLVLAGDNRTRPHVDPRALAAALGLADRVEWREYVSDAELDALYRSARVFAFLSTYEGFAMTPLEALSYDVPPVLLDTAVAHEIYADAALFAAADPSSIAAAITTLLTDDDAHQRLVDNGRRLMARYSWTRAANTIRGALERAAGSR